MNPSPNLSSSDAAGRSLVLPWDGREVRFAEPTPLRQLALLDVPPHTPRESQLTAALALYLPEWTAEQLHALTLPDRHALIHALCLFAGDTSLEVVAECSGCQERLELSLDLASIEPPKIPRPLVIERSERCLTGRPPTPADLAEVADEAELVTRCFSQSTASAAVWLEAASAALEACDPLGDMQIAGACTQCGQTLAVDYDLPGTWLGRQLRRAARLLHEVHVLASSYHWSEEEILALAPARRLAYLDLCTAPSEGHLEVLS